MKNKSNLMAYGLMSLALIFGIYLSVAMVKNKQDSRSSAASEEELVTNEETVDGVCGLANGQTVNMIPSDEDACEVGAINWFDTNAADGTYNWACYGSSNGVNDECSAELFLE
jgi:hypothetical protein